MIGVIAKDGQGSAVEEFFELFKTPWEFYVVGRRYDVVITTSGTIPEILPKLLIVCGAGSIETDHQLGISEGRRYSKAILGNGKTALPIYRGVSSFKGCESVKTLLSHDAEPVALATKVGLCQTIRLGYDPFDELEFLTTVGQPVENAQYPVVEEHVGYLRTLILDCGIPLLEVLPTPYGYQFQVCLTHDIDFVGIRRHVFDHSMFGFLYRASIGAFRRFIKGSISAKRMLQCWAAVASLPLVMLGWVQDFWEPFEWYLEVERGLPATYFLIPFKHRTGERVPGRNAERRASAYGVSDIPDCINKLLSAGCEIGVHGIDSWHDVQKGREEREEILKAIRADRIGTRIHWLLWGEHTPATLEAAGYEYDSTFGYNEVPGYRAGLTQVFRPTGASSLLELPMHIQDGALFYPERSNLSEQEAEKVCDSMIENSKRYGGVLTLLWHDRSHGPERYWGGFYQSLIKKLRSSNICFGSASQVVGWFQLRRKIRFERIGSTDEYRIALSSDRKPQHPFNIRRYSPAASEDNDVRTYYSDTLWSGEKAFDSAVLINREHCTS